MRCMGLLEHVIEDSSVRRYYHVRLRDPPVVLCTLSGEMVSDSAQYRIRDKTLLIVTWGGVRVEEAIVNGCLIVEMWIRHVF